MIAFKYIPFVPIISCTNGKSSSLICSLILVNCSLSKELGQEDYRIERINGLIKRYNHVYECIVVEIVSNTPGKLVVRLVCDGKSITTSQMPRLSSNCANQFSTRLSGDNIVIEYNSDYCYAQDDNFIDLRFKFGTKFVKKQVSFKLK